MLLGPAARWSRGPISSARRETWAAAEPEAGPHPGGLQVFGQLGAVQWQMHCIPRLGMRQLKRQLRLGRKLVPVRPSAMRADLNRRNCVQGLAITSAGLSMLQPRSSHTPQRIARHRRKHVYVVLVSLGMVGVADIAAHGQTQQLAAKMVIQSSADDLFAVVQVL